MPPHSSQALFRSLSHHRTCSATSCVSQISRSAGRAPARVTSRFAASTCTGLGVVTLSQPACWRARRHWPCSLQLQHAPYCHPHLRC